MAEANPGRVTLVVGPEDLLADRAVTAAVEAARAIDAATDVRELAAAALSLGALTELASPSLFAERKVLVIRGLQDAAAELAKEVTALMAKAPEDVSLVLVHNGGQKGKALLDAARKAGAHEVTCAAVKTRRDRLAFVRAEFRRCRRKATDGAVEALLDAVGSDLRALASACGQLDADSPGVIDIDVVRLYYEGQADATGFNVADRAVEGRTADALLQLRWTLQAGTDPVPIVAAMAMALRSIVKVASAPRGLSQADLARQLAMPPWKIDVARRQARGWRPDSVAAALAAVASADAEVKGGGVDPVYALERCVISIAEARQT